MIEIGVGSGSFIADLARRSPQINVLGVDRASQSIARSYRRLRDGDLPNARLFKGDADFVARNVIPPGGLRRVYVNFPDPWPREKHRHRRLLQPPFLRLLAARLEKPGDVQVTTDHGGYFDFVLGSAATAGCFRVDVQDPPPELLETKWARKASTYYHVVLTPCEPVEEHPIDIELVEPMYHAVLDGELPELTDFEKKAQRFRGGVIVIMDAYRELGGPGYAFLIHVEEKGLSQEVVVEVRESQQGDVVVGLRRFGEPLHTRGLSSAVRIITEWLVERGMTITHKKY